MGKMEGPNQEEVDVSTQHTHDHLSYDLDTIAEANLDSLYRRQLIHEAMQANGTSWAHNPKFDPTKNAQAQYLP